MAKTYYGVDLSEHNGTVDFTKLAKKADFVILRIGWVGNGKHKLDKNFKKNYTAAKKAGIRLGAYVYIYSKTPEAAKEGAKWVLGEIKGLSFGLPIYCDMEDRSIASLGKTKLTKIAEAFNDEIINGGYRAGIYANLDWYKNRLLPSIKEYYTWIAHYTKGNNKYRGEYGMWQNSSTGKISGVKGNVDTDYLYEDIFQKGKKSVNELAKEVIDGKWGNGSERKKRLKAAGYDYKAVQKRVNELIKNK